MIYLSEFEDMIRDHMDAQPHEITCAECGEELTVLKQETDGDMDLKITVAPCERCLKEAKE